MYLIPMEIYERLIIEKKPLEEKINSLGNEMSSIIDDEKNDDLSKAIMHQQTLRKYLNYKKQKKRVKSEDTQKRETQVKAENTRELSIEELSGKVPKTYKAKAVSILQSLPEEVSWNSEGKIVHKGKLLEKSNLFTIIHALSSNSQAQKDKASLIEGWNLIKSLSEQNTGEQQQQTTKWARL